MRVLLSTVFVITTCSSSPLAAEHSEIHFCLYEISGQLFDQPYNEPSRSLNCGNMTYCQKITANYISIGDKRTHIVMRGCDGIQVPPAFYSPKCEKDGCSEITSNGEKYQMCCCRGDHCNSSTLLASISVLPITLIALIALS